MQSISALAYTWHIIVPYLLLFKARLVFLLLVVAGTSAIVAERGIPSAEQLGLLFLAGALASAGASALNHYLDRDIDALMLRTCHRPLPSGKIKAPSQVIVLGVGLIITALFISLTLNVPVTIYILLGYLFYVVLYTWWLKRRTQLSVIIGGVAGSFAAMAGWATVGAPFSPMTFFIAVLVFLWTPLHFWNFALVNRTDYQRAGISLLGDDRKLGWYIWGIALILVVYSLLPGLLGYLGVYYLVPVVLLNALLWGNFWLPWKRELAWMNYKISGLYLVGLLAAIVIDTLL